MAPIVRLGLTGGIGSGKSTVARSLAELGAAIVDTDAIARDLTAVGGLAMPSIAATFGQKFITSAGALDRERMRALAFTDATARKRLESIIHPLVGLEAQRQASSAAGEGRACVVFDIPLLVESSVWRQKLDHVLVVDCTPEIQISRVMARSNLTRDAIEKIISSQVGRERRLCAADTVICNIDLSLTELAGEVRQISHRFGLSFK
ncbi:dephospho-CoA kinase [Rhodoferax ferrireducens]|uniref:dephospho-CoA kinase n=1 Tax=Rhodoferax ferrireducens TaxID=192843 RepID=UPI000E0DE627|nr:dephospho-CoA kinase [Rhodoferax ferrireducens]